MEKKLRILVCGATGFIGRNMVEHFSRSGHEVHAARLNTQPIPYEISGLSWHTSESKDLRDSEHVENLIEKTRPDIIIQAAATTSGSRDIVNNPALHVTDNAVMNAYIFRAATEAKVGHVIFFSCSTMFRDGVVTEDSPIDIHPKYFGVACTKLYNEKMCEFYTEIGDTKFTVIRHSNIYGPHDKFDLERSHFFGATVTKVMRAQEKITVWGTGEESRDLLYVSDLCDFVQLAIEKQSGKFGLYNCGYGIAFKVKDVVQRIIDASGKKLTIEHDLSAPTIPTSLCLDSTKAKQELGWNPKVTLPDGITKTLEWWKQNAS